MEFDFNVNELFSGEINKIDGTKLALVPDSRSRPGMLLSHRNRQNIDQILDVIDGMGLASAKAQGLNRTITSGTKLRESDHILYVMTDLRANHGKGSVTGILKMGKKKLFLVDQAGVQHEMTPQCVLDFYVHESCQRQGYGKILFEFMMKDLKIRAHQLAIDRPSPKFLAFLMRHYRLSNPVHQGNHFTVFAEIFSQTRSDLQIEKSRRSVPSFISSKPKLQMSNRQSYPPTTTLKNEDEQLSKISGSVASVVFGQHHTEQNERYSPRFQQKVDRTMEHGTDLGIFRPVVDSSFNIFGVPSVAYSQHSGAAAGNQG